MTKNGNLSNFWWSYKHIGIFCGCWGRKHDYIIICEWQKREKPAQFAIFFQFLTFLASYVLPYKHFRTPKCRNRFLLQMPCFHGVWGGSKSIFWWKWTKMSIWATFDYRMSIEMLLYKHFCMQKVFSRFSRCFHVLCDKELKISHHITSRPLPTIHVSCDNKWKF